MNTCTESGCNSVEFSKGKCVRCSIIGEGEELKTRERPRQPPVWEYTKVKPKMFARPR